MVQQNSKKKCKGCKDSGIYQSFVTNPLTSFIMVTFLAAQNNFILPGRTWGKVFLRGMSKNV